MRNSGFRGGGQNLILIFNVCFVKIHAHCAPLFVECLWILVRIFVPKNLQSENVMDVVIFRFALPFLAIGSAGEPQTPMSAALLRTAAWSCSVAPCKLMGK